MNLLDLIIAAAAVAAGAGGYRLGFLARATSWIGMGVGLYVAARLLPSAVELLGDGADSASRLLIVAVVLLGGAFLGQGLGLLAGMQLRTAVPPGPARGVDRGVGAFLGVLGVVVALWFLLPAMSDVKGSAARLTRSSTVAGVIDEVLPQPPETVQSLRTLVGDVDFPKVFEGLYRAPETGPPPASTGLPVAVLEKVKDSTVKIQGRACSRTQEGSGFVIAANTVVTNAHVVAGEKTTDVLRPDRKRVKATVTVFDSARDLAILRADGLGLSALPMVDKTEDQGSQGAVLGHPGGQEAIAVAPSKINRRVQAVGRDLYDRRSTTRDVFILASRLAPGYSGGPLVNTAGQVAGVAFAIAPDRDGVSYALTDAELREALATNQGRAQSTGPCVSG
ncbi:MAG: MarP family serine protease [Acidimicrobiales bacterium]